tara:strand:- start:315 stop:695 length:381 start_codon:yes stop_codon:yes gene_type:complete
MSNDMNHHIKVYRNVFIVLLVFTVLTVSVSYFDFGGIVWLSVFVGLAIASFKGYLVASNFMHLNNEKPLIYQILIVTLLGFIVLFSMPTLWHNDGLKSPANVPLQNGNVYNSDFESDHSGGHGDHH